MQRETCAKEKIGDGREYSREQFLYQLRMCRIKEALVNIEIEYGPMIFSNIINIEDINIEEDYFEIVYCNGELKIDMNNVSIIKNTSYNYTLLFPDKKSITVNFLKIF